MHITIYGSDKCLNCQKVKEWASEHSHDHSFIDLALTLAHHEGWRSDGSTELMSYINYTYPRPIDIEMPILLIDGDYFTYYEFRTRYMLSSR